MAGVWPFLHKKTCWNPQKERAFASKEEFQTTAKAALFVELHWESDTDLRDRV